MVLFLSLVSSGAIAAAAEPPPRIEPQISAGAEHSVFLRADGILWIWGQNKDGQLGDNTEASKAVPSAIVSLERWAQIAAGANRRGREPRRSAKT